MVGRPRVSILMPTHSRVDVIGYAIQSVLDQTMGDFELLVVGDGCAPGTADVVASFNDSRMRFFDLPKAPHFGYANRNIALREARGELIGFAADDDLLLPDHLEVLSQSLRKEGTLAYSQAVWISTDGIGAPFLTNLTLPDELHNFMERGNTIPASCFLYRANCLPVRSVWQEDVTSAADWHLWRRIIRENPNSPVLYCRTPTVLHFSARWKNSRHSAVRELQTYLEVADQVNWWPSALRVQVSDGQKEQAAYSTLMRADPARWKASMREAVLDLGARLAWENVQTIRPSLAAVKGHLALAKAEASSHNNQVAILEKSLADAMGALKAARTDNEMLFGQISAALEENKKQSGDIEAMRSTTAWRIHQMLRGLSSRFRTG